MSKSIQGLGIKTITLDKRKRTGKCTPDIRVDFMKWDYTSLPQTGKYVFWFGLPCQTHSYASGDYHWRNGEPRTEEAREALIILSRVFEVIEYFSGSYYVIENPRGRLRFNKDLGTFMEKTGGAENIITLSSYGFPCTKPTNLFSNIPLNLKPMDKFGRGNKSNGNFNNLTTHQRQTYPLEMCQALSCQIVKFMDNLSI